MTREPRAEPAVPTQDDLMAGLRQAFEVLCAKTDLGHAVGETGTLRGEVEIFLERGRGKHYKGTVYFQQRMETRRG